MDTLLFVKGIIGVVVFVAAIIALLTQLQMRKRISPIIKASPKVLRSWHLWMGRIALAAFVLNSVICLLIGMYPAFRSDPRHLVHGLVASLCLVVFLGKTWITRRKIKWGMKRVVVLGIVLFSLQLAVFMSATVFAIGERIAGLA